MAQRHGSSPRHRAATSGRASGVNPSLTSRRVQLEPRLLRACPPARTSRTAGTRSSQVPDAGTELTAAQGLYRHVGLRLVIVQSRLQVASHGFADRQQGSGVSKGQRSKKGLGRISGMVGACAGIMKNHGLPAVALPRLSLVEYVEVLRVPRSRSGDVRSVPAPTDRDARVISRGTEGRMTPGRRITTTWAQVQAEVSRS